MPQAQIVKAWTEGSDACMAVRVQETQVVDGASQSVAVEYVGRLAMDDGWAALTLAQKKAALVQACKSVRDAGQAPARVDLAGVSGQVAI
jgi:hypothetical protein